ncbi:hypothetical protein AgCh_000451 [Apium graveolens]
MQNCLEGEYLRKPTIDASPTVHFLLNEKGLLKNTPRLSGQRELHVKLLTPCVSRILKKKYYTYPFPYDDEDGDQVVRSYLRRNWKSYPGAKRNRLVEKVKHLLES